MIQKLLINRCKLIAITLSLVLTGALFAQDGHFERKSFLEGMTITGSLGATHYWGDLRDAVFPQAVPFINQSKLGGGLSVHKNVFKFLDLGVKGIYSELEAKDDDKRPSTNNIYSFNTKIWEIGVDANIKFGELLSSKKERRLSSLGILGYGVNGYNSTAIVTYPDGFSTELINRPEARPSGKTSNGVYYYGLGLEYELKNNWAVGIETSIYNLSVDNLDGWGDDASANDKYTYTAVNLSYTIPSLEVRNKKRDWPMPEQSDNKTEPEDNMKPEVTDDQTQNVDDDQENDSDTDVVDDVEEEITDEMDDSDDDTNSEESDISIDSNMQDLTIIDFRDDVIYFELNESEASEALNLQVKAISNKLKNHPDVNITLAGYADKDGTEEYNRKLSLRRAEWVKKLLIENYGIKATRLKTEGRGESESVEEINSNDRRVEVIEVN